MKLTKKHINKGFTLVELLVVIAIIAALAAMATPVIMKQQKKAAMTEATSNAKQVFYLLVEFDQDYGSFPNDDTASEIGTSGSSSNDYLSQFIEGGYTKSEEIFFAKGGATPSRKPDNVVTGDSMLEQGECGFAYIKDQSTSVNTGRPLLVAPYDGSNAFKPDPYDGKAVVLRVDGAVKQLLMDKESNEAKIGGGKTLFDTAGDTVWGTDTVDIAEPKSKS